MRRQGTLTRQPEDLCLDRSTYAPAVLSGRRKRRWCAVRDFALSLVWKRVTCVSGTTEKAQIGNLSHQGSALTDGSRELIKHWLYLIKHWWGSGMLISKGPLLKCDKICTACSSLLFVTLCSEVVSLWSSGYYLRVSGKEPCNSTITEWLQLDGTCRGHLIQALCSSGIT